MAEDVARAVGASAGTITIAGKTCQIRPLTVRELTELERECLKQYKRQRLEEFAEMLLPEEDRESAIRAKRDELLRLDTGDLPVKWAHDPAKITVTEQLTAWLDKTVGLARTDGNGEALSESALQRQIARMAAAALDGHAMTWAEYESLTGSAPIRMQVGYVNWWITGTYDGLITLLWISCRDAGVTRDEVAQEFRLNRSAIVEASYEIDRVTAPAVGNG